MPCAGRVSASVLEELGRAVRLDERQRVGERSSTSTPHVASRPSTFAPRSHDRVGDVRAGEHRLVLAVLAVPEHHPAALDRARRVREVVGEHLVLVELGDGDARRRRSDDACERVGGGVDDLGRAVDGGGRRGELVRHAAEPTDEVAPRLARSGVQGCVVLGGSAAWSVGTVAASSSWSAVRSSSAVAVVVVGAVRRVVVVVVGGLVAGGDGHDRAAAARPADDLGAARGLQHRLHHAGHRLLLHLALRVEHLEHRGADPVGARLREVHAVARAHRDRGAVRVVERRERGLVAALVVAEQRVRVDEDAPSGASRSRPS